LWVPPDPEVHADVPDAERRAAALERRLAYLEQRRQERNLAFQAVFLHALGRIGFALGESARWAADAAVLDKLEMFGTQSWKAYDGSDAEGRDVKIRAIEQRLAAMLESGSGSA
jgi:hypothetical protein